MTLTAPQLQQYVGAFVRQGNPTLSCSSGRCSRCAAASGSAVAAAAAGSFATAAAAGGGDGALARKWDIPLFWLVNPARFDDSNVLLPLLLPLLYWGVVAFGMGHDAVSE